VHTDTSDYPAKLSLFKTQRKQGIRKVDKIFKIVITGPESTGKTTLAQALARALQAPWAPEFARYYTAHLGRPYHRSDLRAIGRGQRLWERWYAAQSTGLLILDTDWTVLQIWESYRFAPAGPAAWREGYGEAAPADLYVLCTPDFPWAPDPLREHPEEQTALFDLYAQLLAGLPTPHIVVEGSPDARLKKVCRAIETFNVPLR
jgi:nicotinamide riboside kinase